LVKGLLFTAVLFVDLVVRTLIGVGTAWAQDRGHAQNDQSEKITLQYRVARDAFAPSRFVAVVDGGISAPLELVWDLPSLDDKRKSEAQGRQKKEFDDLIKQLEQKSLNGVEFESTGVWEPGFRFRLTSVPRVSEAGKRTLEESRPQ
jgi:hypothetical protein